MRKIYATSGCFSLLHEGHKAHLKSVLEAVPKDGELIIAVNTDKYIQHKYKEFWDKLPLEAKEELWEVNRQESIYDFFDSFMFPEENVTYTRDHCPLVLITDTLIADIKALYLEMANEMVEVVWIVNNEYKTKDFKERLLADDIIYVNSTPRMSSSELLRAQCESDNV